jgi:hypothetical protein
LLVSPHHKIEKEQWWVGVPTLFLSVKFQQKEIKKKKLVIQVDLEGFNHQK